MFPDVQPAGDAVLGPADAAEGPGPGALAPARQLLRERPVPLPAATRQAETTPQ